MASLLRFLALCLALIAVRFALCTALISHSDINPPYPKAISELKETIIKGLGLQAEGFTISGFDLKDALVGRSVAYEFDLEIGNKVRPFKLLEDVDRWEYVDLPIFRAENPVRLGYENGLLERERMENQMPVLAPFQLAGPMELWIQDAKDMRLSLPHDVDAGVLKKVILADGAVVTVTGAKSVSLRYPVEFPLPLNQTRNNFASGLLTLAEYLCHASRTQDSALVSLRIVGPTSLTSPSSSSPSSTNKLKLKRLAPGLVELSSVSKSETTEIIPAADLKGEATALITPDHFDTLWPLTSINGSNSNLIGLEALLSSVLGPKANDKGSFKMLKADVSAQTFLKIGFNVEKKLKDDDGVNWESFPAWRTRPETTRMHFEVLAKVDGEKVVPERVVQIEPVVVEDTAAPNVLRGNVTVSKIPVVHPPPNPFTL